LTEYLDVVNEQDEVVDSLPRTECIERGLLHRAVVVFLFNSRGELYLQKRADNVVFYPGFWTASVTGHVSAGETYLEAAIRETKEELGLSVGVVELGKFLSPKWECSDGVDWEIITVFETLVREPKITLSDESQDGKFISVDEFRKLAAHMPPVLTPDTLLGVKYSTRLGEKAN
jgi:isopentenyl-diphosphate Delta-isomerase